MLQMCCIRFGGGNSYHSHQIRNPIETIEITALAFFSSSAVREIRQRSRCYHANQRLVRDLSVGVKRVCNNLSIALVQKIRQVRSSYRYPCS
jgi:hypothetical protein